MGPESSTYLSYTFHKRILAFEILALSVCTMLVASIVSDSIFEVFSNLIVTIFVWGLPVLSYVFVVDRTRFGKSSDTPKFVNLVGSGVWVVIVVVLAQLLYYLSQQPFMREVPLLFPEQIIIVFVPILYGFRLITLARIYAGTEPKFYYTDDSVVSQNWHSASIYLTKATQYLESGVSIRGILFARLAVGRYQDVVSICEEETQIQEYIGGILLARASYELYWGYLSRIYSSKKAEKHIQNFIYLSEEAHRELSYRLCRVCEEKKPIYDTYQIVGDTETYYVCASCYKKQKQHTRTNSTQQKTNAHDHTTNSDYTYDRNRQSGANQTASSNQSLSDDQIKTFCQVLDISQPLSEEKINSAYREQVKNVHPDMEQGSVDDFKSVSEAREKLLEYVSSSD